MKKRLVYFLLALVVLSLLSCTTKRDESVITVAVSSEPPTLDIQKNTSLISRVIALGNIYEKLVTLGEDGRVECELAESYEIGDEGKSLSFKIRDNVLFHNGKKLEKGDAVASLNRYLDSYPSASKMVNNARFYIAEDSVRIDSSAPLYLFLYLLAYSPQSAVIMPENALKSENQQGLVTEIIGTGPYMLSSWLPGSEIVLKKFADYSGNKENKAAKTETLIYRFVSDSIIRRLGLESGSYDLINDASSDDYAFYRSNDKFRLLEDDSSGLIALVFNKKEGIGRDLELRSGLSYALDRESMMKACYGEEGFDENYSYMEANQALWQTGNIDTYSIRNIEEAKALLASYKGQRVRILTSNLSNLDKIALEASYQLSMLGLECEVISVDWASFLTLRRDSSLWDIYISAFSSVPLPTMKSFLSESFPGWISSELSDKVASLSYSASLEEAAESWRSLEKELYAEIPVIVLGHYSTAYAASSLLDGVIIDRGFYLWNAEKRVR